MFFLLFLELFATSKILNISIYDRDSYVDLLLSFDKSFDGKIQQEKKEGKTFIIISGVSFLQDKTFTTKHRQFKQIKIYKTINNKLLIEIKNSNISINAKITKNGYGVRVRLQETKTTKKGNLQNIQFKTDKDIKDSYFLMFLYICILLLGFVVVRLKFFNKANILDNTKIKIISQKYIDRKNRLVLIEFDNIKYLILIGETSSTLIEKIKNKDNSYEQ